MIDTGYEIRKRRKALGLSQVELAKRVGVAHVSISHWESNKNSLTGQNLLAVADELGCSARELVDAGQISESDLLELEAALVKKAYQNSSKEFRAAARRFFGIDSPAHPSETSDKPL